MKRRPTRRRLPTTHGVYDLEPGLLLVCKPRGHTEAIHSHPHAQRLRLLSGRLAVETPRRRVVLTPRSRPLTIAAARSHATRALADTWLVVEVGPGGSRTPSTS